MYVFISVTTLSTSMDALPTKMTTAAQLRTSSTKYDILGVKNMSK